MHRRPLLPLLTNHLLHRPSPKSQTLKTLATTTPKLPAPPNPNSQSLLLSLLSLLSSSNQTLNLDTLLDDVKPNLTSDLVFQTLKSYKTLGRTKTLLFFSWAGSHLSFRFPDRVVDFMADFLGRRKLFDDLKCLLTTVALHRGRLSPRTVAISIRFLGRNGRVSDALSLFESMESELGCRPDNLVFNNLLYVLCKKDSAVESIDTALEIFSKMENPDKYSFSNILVGLCRFGRLENAMEVFREMVRANLVPTRTAANVLVGKLCESSAKMESVENVKVRGVGQLIEILVPKVGPKVGIEHAVGVFWWIFKLGLLPSGHIVAELVSELCRLRRIEEAVGIVKVVEDRKLKCIGECYSLVIVALCEDRRVNEAFDFLRRMGILGLMPKINVHNSIIRCFCKLGSVEEAQKYFENMSRNRCKPDRATYTMLIHAYGTSQNWEAAYGLLMEMIDFGWCPCPDTCNLVEGLLSTSGRSDLSLKLERKMEIQSLLDHCKAGRLEVAYGKLQLIDLKGFNLPIYARDLVERTFRRSGKWKVAREFLKKMDLTAVENNVQG